MFTMFEITDILIKYNKYTDDEIVEMYCDLGAMGDEMDCAEKEWEELSLVYMIRETINNK